MGFGWGAALKSGATSLRDINNMLIERERQRRKDEEDAKSKETDERDLRDRDMRYEMNKLDYDSKIGEKKRYDEGLAALGRAKDALSGGLGITFAPGIKSQVESENNSATPYEYYNAADDNAAINAGKGTKYNQISLPSNQYEGVKQFDEAGLKKRDEAAVYKDLLPYTGTNRDVKEFYEDWKDKNKPTYNKYMERTIPEYNTTAYRDSVREQLENMHKSGRIEDVHYELMKGIIDKPGGAKLASDQIAGIEGEYAKNTVDVDRAYRLIDPESKAAGEKSFASTVREGEASLALRDKGFTGISPKTGKPYTEYQGRQGKNALELEAYNNIIDDATKRGFSEADIDNAILSRIDNQGELRLAFLNTIKDPLLKRYAMAKLGFMIVTLRDESGAAISASEYDTQNARFFPIGVEGKEQLEELRANRILQQTTRMVQSQGAYDDYKSAQYDKLLSGGGVVPSTTPKPTKDKTGDFTQKEIDEASDILKRLRAKEGSKPLAGMKK